jgi:hypothetical protein
MDINNIKGPGVYGPLSEPPAETPAESKRQSHFSDATASLQDALGAKPLGVVSQFSKSALEDPAKLETMVRACASELIDSTQGVAANLSPVDKQALAEFLSADPLLRAQIENYLRKVLV